ncbi:hypothetical protein [Amycolatopsis circi]|uniref:hypothetical protein n=1 Tax=Amycolatopsis circi TaxID=871959 RepID=UPI0013BE96FD|nr:hypothetical protein [Amycolatopsis circi]
MPPSWARYANVLVRRWSTQNGAEAELAATMQAVIDRLNDAPPDIDYRRRRVALHGWLIPEHIWTAATEPLRNLPRPATDFGPCKRHAASLLLWTVITNGDYQAAHLYRHRRWTAPQDHQFLRLAQRLMCEFTNLTRHSRHVMNLLDALTPYRIRLERSIDTKTTTRQ